MWGDCRAASSRGRGSFWGDEDDVLELVTVAQL